MSPNTWLRSTDLPPSRAISIMLISQKSSHASSVINRCPRQSATQIYAAIKNISPLVYRRQPSPLLLLTRNSGWGPQHSARATRRWDRALISGNPLPEDRALDPGTPRIGAFHRALGSGIGIDGGVAASRLGFVLPKSPRLKATN